jgi:hypothetical protein
MAAQEALEANLRTMHAAMDVLEDAVVTAHKHTCHFGERTAASIEEIARTFECVEGLVKQGHEAGTQAAQLWSRHRQHLEVCMFQLNETRKQAVAEHESERRRQRDLWATSELMEGLAAQGCQDLLCAMEDTLWQTQQTWQHSLIENQMRLNNVLRQLDDAKHQLSAEKEAQALSTVAMEQFRDQADQFRRDAEDKIRELETQATMEREARLAAEDRVRDLDDSIRQCEAAAVANVRFPDSQHVSCLSFFMVPWSSMTVTLIFECRFNVCLLATTMAHNCLGGVSACSLPSSRH